jgi:hypothetical protein
MIRARSSYGWQTP